MHACTRAGVRVHTCAPLDPSSVSSPAQLPSPSWSVPAPRVPEGWVKDGEAPGRLPVTRPPAVAPGGAPGPGTPLEVMRPLSPDRLRHSGCGSPPPTHYRVQRPGVLQALHSQGLRGRAEAPRRLDRQRGPEALRGPGGGGGPEGRVKATYQLVDAVDGPVVLVTEPLHAFEAERGR